MNKPTTDFADIFLHSPAKTSTNYVKWAEFLQTAPRINYGCIMDKYVIPLMPGDVMSVIGRPGHDKTSFMAYMTMRTAQGIVERNETNKCAIYVSWEQPVEQIEAFFQACAEYNATDLAWGRVDLDVVRRKAIQRVHLPIWLIGYAATDKRKKPLMTLDAIYECIRVLRYEHNIEPVLLCLDYLQKIPIRGKRSRTEEVTEASHETKMLAMELPVPIIAGVQASRQTEQHKIAIPTMADCQWASAIEQDADKQIALFRPSKVIQCGEMIEVAGHDIPVEKFLLLIKLLKQRGDEGSGIWPVHFEPHTLTMGDYNFKKLE